MLFILTGLLSSVTQANSGFSPYINSSQPSKYILLAQNDGGQSLNEAAESIKQETGGRILSAKTVTKNGQRIYKIKVLLPSGKIQTFTINAE